MKRMLIIIASSALCLSACATAPDTSQTLAALDSAYITTAGSAVATIKSGVLTPTQVGQLAAAIQTAHDGLAAATAGLAACPQVNNVTDKTCANSATITGAIAAAQSALAQATLLTAPGVVSK